MLIKEDEWKDEEQAFHDYYSTEHDRLVNLWKDVVSVKRLFVEMQKSTEKDLSKLKDEISCAGREMFAVSSGLGKDTCRDSTVLVSACSFLISKL